MVITVEAQTVEELRDKIFALALLFGYENAPDGTVISVENDAEGASKKAVAKAKKETKTPLKAVEKTTEKPAEKSEAKPAAEAPKTEAKAPEKVDPYPPTKEGAVEALKLVSSKHGIPEARNILFLFGADRVSTIEAKDYPKFIETCLAEAKKPKVETGAKENKNAQAAAD